MILFRRVPNMMITKKTLSNNNNNRIEILVAQRSLSSHNYRGIYEFTLVATYGSRLFHTRRL